MNIERVIAGYLRVAREDLEGAIALARIPNRNAVYLCSQAAEKVIRAVLTSEGKHAGVGYQLDRMVDMIPDENPIKPLLRDIEGLGAFATSFRYPTVVGRIKAAPSEAEFQRFAAGVEAALSRALTRFEVDVSAADQPAGNADPIR